jgi:hypothetical protein
MIAVFGSRSREWGMYQDPSARLHRQPLALRASAVPSPRLVPSMRVPSAAAWMIVSVMAAPFPRRVVRERVAESDLPLPDLGGACRPSYSFTPRWSGESTSGRWEPPRDRVAEAFDEVTRGD